MKTNQIHVKITEKVNINQKWITTQLGKYKTSQCQKVNIRKQLKKKQKTSHKSKEQSLKATVLLWAKLIGGGEVAARIEAVTTAKTAVSCDGEFQPWGNSLSDREIGFGRNPLVFEPAERSHI